MLGYKMNEKWRYYGVLGPLIWAYTVMAKSKGNTIRNLWIGYAVLGALLAADIIKFKDEDNHRNEDGSYKGGGLMQLVAYGAQDVYI